MPPENPVTDHSDSNSSEDDLATKPSRSRTATSAKRPAMKPQKSPDSQPDEEILAPTAQWFLSVAPHESSIKALIVRPRSGNANHLRARAEETARTLLLNWTNIDPDSIPESKDGSWNLADNSDSYIRSSATDRQTENQSYLPSSSYPPQPYPAYAPQQWYQPPVYTLPPSMVTAPSIPLTSNEEPPHEKQTDSEALARLKKLILDEKAEQDRKAAAVVAPPPTAPSPPIATEDLQEDILQREKTTLERVDSLHMPVDSNEHLKAVHPKLQPVTMRDWLGRKFVFPIHMCQTWEVGIPSPHTSCLALICLTRASIT